MLKIFLTFFGFLFRIPHSFDPASRNQPPVSLQMQQITPKSLLAICKENPAKIQI
jgi:hypothetical protein